MKVPRVSAAVAGGVFLYSNVAIAANSTESLKSETSLIAKNLAAYYTTNLTTTGVLPSPYPWSEAASLFATLINYAYYTGDTTYSDTVAKGLVAQIGSNNDFLPSSESSTAANSDQALWALAALTAVETGFQNPSDSAKLGWLGFAQNVWQDQSKTWNGTTTCGGGLSAALSGSGDKDGLSNGEFLALSARLARYTGNSTFGNAAETVYSWAETSGLLSKDGAVFASLSSSDNCSSANEVQWSADAGAFLLGAAHMYNFTNGATTWKTRLTTLLTETLKTFTPNGDDILIEVACERQLNCTTTELSYKSQLAQSLVDMLTVAPSFTSTITPVLQASANGAVTSCSVNGSDANATGVCGTQWTWGRYDDLTGAGEEMAALAVIQGLMVNGTGGGFKVESNGASASSTAGASGTGTGTSSSASSTSSKKSGAEKMVVGYCSVLLGLVAMVFVGLL